MVFVNDREHLISVLRLHYRIINVGNCLFFLYERVEVDRHESAEEVWEPTQAIESTCVGVLFSTDYETSQFLCFWAQWNLMISAREITY